MKTVIVRYLDSNKEMQRMFYTASSSDCAKFAAYYRPKVGNGNILSVITC